MPMIKSGYVLAMSGNSSSENKSSINFFLLIHLKDSFESLNYFVSIVSNVKWVK